MPCYINKVGISGKMGSGKSTVARLMVARLTNATGIVWKVRGFADSLKCLVCKIYRVPLCLGYTDVGKQTVPPMLKDKITHEILPVPITDIDLEYVNKYLAEEAVFPHTLGRLFQIVGNVFRQIDPNYWVRAFEASLKPDEYIVIEDLRYPNEAEWIINNFGVVCRVNGPHRICPDGRSQQHISESALDDFTSWDFTIDNTIHGPDMSKLHKDIVEKLAKYI